MPVYDFLCGSCGAFEQRLSFAEAGDSASCPDCGSTACRVYSMPGVTSTSRADKKVRSLNEKGKEPKLLKKSGTEKTASGPRPAPGGRPWLIGH